MSRSYMSDKSEVGGWGHDWIYKAQDTFDTGYHDVLHSQKVISITVVSTANLASK